MAKGKLDRDLEEAARDALKKALEVEEHGIKAMVRGALEEAITEYRESMRHVALEMVPTTGDTVGNCEICNSLVKVTNLKRVPWGGRLTGPSSDAVAQWILMCSECAKILDEKGKISRVTVRYEEAYTTESREKGVVEKQEKT